MFCRKINNKNNNKKRVFRICLSLLLAKAKNLSKSSNKKEGTAAISYSHTKLNFTWSIATENELLENYLLLDEIFGKIRMYKLYQNTVAYATRSTSRK